MGRLDLTERLRSALAAETTLREVTMFGARSFMVNDRMVAAARKSGDLLLRIPPERYDELLGRPGTAQAEMGVGRGMGPGWLAVAEEAVAEDEQLAFWLDVALEFNRSR